jgi:hypothetical protein
MTTPTADTPNEYGLSHARDNITAHPGGLQASAFPISGAVNRITVVASAGDSVVLPGSLAGMAVTIINATATSANVFPEGTDQINALGASAAFALAGGKSATFYCSQPGIWGSILSA